MNQYFKEAIIVYQTFYLKTKTYKGEEISDPKNFERYFEWEAEDGDAGNNKTFIDVGLLPGDIRGFVEKNPKQAYYLMNLPLEFDDSNIPSVSRNIKGYGQVMGAKLALPLSDLQYKTLRKELAGIKNLEIL